MVYLHLDLFPRPLFFKSFFFTHSHGDNFSKFSLSKLSGAGGHGRCRKYLRRPLRYVCSEPGSYSLTLFSFSVGRISTTKKCFRSCGASVVEMVFKFSSVLCFSKVPRLPSGRTEVLVLFFVFSEDMSSLKIFISSSVYVTIDPGISFRCRFSVLFG